MSIINNCKRIMSGVFATALVATSSLAAISGTADAAVINATPKAQVTFTFDDGMQSAYTQAAPAMKKHGITGVAYVTTGCIGMTKAPNSCRADTSVPYMSWTQVKALQSTYGWEIGSHTVTHPLLASSGAWANQPNKLTPSQVEAELKNSKSALAAQGINATAFASPYGDYDNTTLGIIAKYYTSHRGFADTGMNTWPHSDLIVRNIPVQTGVTVASVKAQIDQAIANNQWAVLTFHNIKTNTSTAPNYDYRTADLEAIAAYVKSKQDAGLIRNVNATNGLVTAAAADNLLPNSTFDSALTTGGWRTDNPTAVTRNTGNNGSFPGVTNSVRFAPNAAPARLFTPLVSVNGNSEYVLKNYVKVQGGNGTGAVEFYIDEYDVNGNWISGQYKGGVSNWTATHNFAYKPTSLAVVKADLQITNTAGSGITAFLDNSQWYVTKAGEDPTPPVPQTNLVANGTFDAGIAAGWSTDNAAVLTADNTSNGSPSNVVNSVRFQAGASTGHLFSPLVSVDPAKAYTLRSFVRLNTLTSNEVGFYIDEYDVNGNWISGQYKGGVRSVSTGDVTIAYTPSSSAVAKSSLQVIVDANSGATGYFDDVRWFLNQ